MLTISRHTDYAARIVLHLALEGEGARVTAREIAERRLIPPAFIRRIVSRLSAVGILRTSRGNGGGITLARPASRITLLEVVTAMEGELALNGCTADPESCPLSPTCTVRATWEGATVALAKYLKKADFASLARAGARGRGRRSKTGR